MSNLQAPHIRTEARAGHMILDVLMCVLPLCIYSAVNYGMRPVWVVLLSMLAAILCDAIVCVVTHRRMRTILDGSAAVTGAIIGLVMSPMVEYWVPMVGVAFAIFVAKAPFGGYGRNVFNPAAAGLAMLTYCFPHHLFTYPAASAVNLSSAAAVDTVVTAPSLAAQLRAGATPTVTFLQLVLGDFAGPIGATAILVLLACGAYLIFRRSISAWTVLPYLATCTLMAVLSPLTGTDLLYGTAAQLCAGYVLFTGVFLLNDPVTTPRFWLGRVLYGTIAGVLVMLLQQIGRAETGCCFAILIMNALSPMLDRWTWHGWRLFTQRRRVRQEVKVYE